MSKARLSFATISFLAVSTTVILTVTAIICRGGINCSVKERPYLRVVHGYIDRTGAWAIDPKFSSAGPFKHGVAGVQMDNFRTENGKMLCSPVFHTIDRSGNSVWTDSSTNFHVAADGSAQAFLNEQMYALGPDRSIVAHFEDSSMRIESELPLYYRGGKWSFKNRQGRLVQVPNITNLGSFVGGFAPAKDARTSLYGYLDETGKWSIKPQFSTASEFSEGLATISRITRSGGEDGDWDEAELYGFIDSSGKAVIPPQYSSAGLFSEGLAWAGAVGSDDKGYIDKKGKWVILPQYRTCEPFKEGTAKVFNDKWTTVKHIAPPRQAEVSEWAESRVSTKECFFIDKTGRNVAPGYTPSTPSADSRLVPVIASGKTGYVDSRGRMVIPPRFEAGRMFSDGLGAVFDGRYWGFIDRTGKYVIEPKFEDVGSFENGLAPFQMKPVFLPGQWGYIDRSGKVIIAPQYDRAENFSEGLAAVMKNDIGGFVKEAYLIDTAGKRVAQVKPRREGNLFAVDCFSEGLAPAAIELRDKP